MKTLKLVSMLVVAVALAAVILQNSQALVEVRFLWWTGQLSAIVLLLLTVVGGFILGLLTVLLATSGTKSNLKQKGA